MQILDFVKLLFVGSASLLLLKNKTSSYTNSDAATHEDKLLAFIHKNISLLIAVLSCYDSERNFGKVQIFPMKVEMLLFASVKLRRLPEQKAASQVLVS